MINRLFLLSAICLVSIFSARAQDTTKARKKANVMETIKQVPDMLIEGKDNSKDSSMYFLKNDNLSLRVQPKWQEVGTQTGNDLKLDKINDDPLDATFPLPEKKLANGLIITMTTVKKPVDEKKKAVMAQIKTDLAKMLKDAGKSLGSQEMDETVNSMNVGLEPFKTDEGKEGQIYLFNDYTSKQSNFLIDLLIPGAKPNTTVFIQFDYLHYQYDNIPDDLSELRVFPYPDDQATYVDFTKKILKTLKIE
jgi:hypothetical protein